MLRAEVQESVKGNGAMNTDKVNGGADGVGAGGAGTKRKSEANGNGAGGPPKAAKKGRKISVNAPKIESTSPMSMDTMDDEDEDGNRVDLGRPETEEEKRKNFPREE